MSEDVERIWAEATRRYPDPHPNASGLNSPRRIAFKVGAEWAIDAMTTPQVVETLMGHVVTTDTDGFIAGCQCGPRFDSEFLWAQHVAGLLYPHITPDADARSALATEGRARLAERDFQSWASDHAETLLDALDPAPDDVSVRRAVLLWAERFLPGDRWDTEDLRDLRTALGGTVEANPDRTRARAERPSTAALTVTMTGRQAGRNAAMVQGLLSEAKGRGIEVTLIPGGVLAEVSAKMSGALDDALNSDDGADWVACAREVLTLINPKATQ